MAALNLTVAEYRDRVLGGWLGKTIGITLGAGSRGRPIPGTATYYHPVPGQPAPSLAMDFPLVWLKVLEEYGPDAGADDLAVAWLEHLDYHEDEYGYAALNLRRGLPPPASGSYSNWFKTSTGGMMRADLWAMIAPGAPQQAAALAYRDASIDHAEEGVWAAMFTAAIGSAAFFLTDPLPLLTIGLAMIPRTCRTARAVKAALAAAHRGATWLDARESVLKEVGHANYTDVAQNVGYLTIGLLFGIGDFGASLCAGVNCGHDSEAVGAALGAILGIRMGAARLPENWTGPVRGIVIPGQRLRDFDIPESLEPVVDRVVNLGRQFVEARCPDLLIAEYLPEPEPEPMPEPVPAPQPQPVATASPDLVEVPVPDSVLMNGTASDIPEPVAPVVPVESPAMPTEAPEFSAPEPEPAPSTGLQPQAVDYSAIETPIATAPAPPPAPDLTSAIAWADNTLVKPLLVTSPNAFMERSGMFEVIMETGDGPSIGFGQIKSLVFTIINRSDSGFTGGIQLLAPPGWLVGVQGGLGARQYIAGNGGILRVEFNLRIGDSPAKVDLANAIRLRLAPVSGAAPTEIQFLLLGASCWWFTGPFANFDGEGYDRSYTPEERSGLNEKYVSRMHQTVGWERRVFHESVLDLESIFKGSSGVYYGQTVLRSPDQRAARLVANTNTGVKLWLNGQLVLRRFHRETFRPVIGAGPWAVDVTLQSGDNRIMVKWIRGTEPYQFSLTVSDPEGRGVPEVGNTAW